MRVLTIIAGLCLSAVVIAEEPTDAAFSVCAACHLAGGEGIPAAFPPLRNRLAAIAMLEGGREYLIAVSLYGLAGPIDAGGSTYNSFMAGQTSLLDAATLAQALNHAVFELNDEPDQLTNVARFSTEEIASVQQTIPQATPQATATMRAELIRNNAEQWPE